MDIRNALAATLTVDVNQRQQAEAFLQNAQSQPNFAPTLMQLLSAPCNPGDEPLVLAAAVIFKNYIKSRWVSKDERGRNAERDVTVETGISEPDRTSVKESLLPLSLSLASSGSPVAKQLIASLIIMADADFPNLWENLLPNLMASLSQAVSAHDTTKMLATLKLVDSLLRRFRSSGRSESETAQQLRYCMELTNTPLLELLNSLIQPITQASQGTVPLTDEQSNSLLDPVVALGKLFHIFYSVTYLVLPEFYEDHLNEWMGALRLTLRFPPALLSDTSSLANHKSGSDSLPGPLLKVQALACRSLSLFVQKYEDEFLPFLPDFVADIWGLVTKLPVKEEKCDMLAVSAIDFLSAVAISVHYHLFEQENALDVVLTQIILPSITLRTSDEELFEDEPVEYIRRDIEGSDADTRRKAACDLIRSLRRRFDEKVTNLCSTHVTTLMQLGAQGDWRAKDAAFYLITALAVSATTKATGASQVNSLVPVLDFFQTQALPELQSAQVAAGTPDDQKIGQLILKADALKFATIFRLALPDTSHSQLVPAASELLTNTDSYVVRAYAAHFLERMVALRQPTPAGQSTASAAWRLPAEAIDQVATKACQGLFQAMTMDPPRSPYLARCLMRVLSRTSGAQLLQMAEFVATQLNQQLEALAANPGAPDFTHCLFEATASLIGGCAKVQPATVDSFEGALFPLFQKILAANIAELSPYVFQLLAMLLELSGAPQGQLSPAYQSLLPPLLDLTVWQSKGNVPGLVRLLQAYLRRGGVAMQDKLPQILEIFGRLVRNRTTDHEAFLLLEGVVQHLPFAAFQPQLGAVFKMIFARLTANKTVKVVNSFDIWLAMLLSMHEPDTVVTTIESMQKGLFGMVLESLWLPHLQTVKGTIEKKMCAIASIRLLARCQVLRAPDGYQALFPGLLVALVKLFELPTEEVGDASLTAAFPGLAGDDDGFGGSGSGYSAAFNKLRCAQAASVDPFADVAWAHLPQLLATQLHEASRATPGVFPALLAAANDPHVQTALSNYFQAANIAPPFVS